MTRAPQPEQFGHAALVIDEASPDLTARQVEALRQAADALVTPVLVLCGRGLDASDADIHDSATWAELQRRHLREHKRHPHKRGLPAANIRLGDGIDRLLWRACNLIDLAIEYVRVVQLRDTRRALRQEAAASRRARLAERKAAREAAREAQRAAAEARTRQRQTARRTKRAIAPRCAKCNKRPRARGPYCVPCAEWESHHR